MNKRAVEKKKKKRAVAGRCWGTRQSMVSLTLIDHRKPLEVRNMLMAALGELCFPFLAL